MMPMALAWSFLCSLFSSIGDLLLLVLWALLNSSETDTIGQQLERRNITLNNHIVWQLRQDSPTSTITSTQTTTPTAATIGWLLNLTAQIITKLLIYVTINLVCLYTKYLIDLAQRNAFLETRRSIETRAKIARENDKQERLLLSLLPRFVALEIIADIAKEDNHEKLLRNQFHKIYIHSYSNVRLVVQRVIKLT